MRAVAEENELMKTLSSQPARSADPIDQLVPAPRPWWIRLLLAALIVAAVALVGYWWRYGVLRPSPDCCGSGSTGTQIGPSETPGAVTLVTGVFNSSGRDITITSARAELPGASVLAIAPYGDLNGWSVPPDGDLTELPVVLPGHDFRRFAVTFTPDDCASTDAEWGRLTLEMEVAGSPWYPTMGRTWSPDEAIVDRNRNPVSVLPPEGVDVTGVDNGDPLAAACLLLGR